MPIRALLVAAILAGCGGSVATETEGDPTDRATPEPVGGTGEVIFGVGLDDGLNVEQEQDTFAVGEMGSFSGNFTEPAGATSVTIIVSSRDASGTEGVVYTEDVTISDPTFDIFGIEDIDMSILSGGEPGDYVLRFFRESTELAEGTFTIAP